MGGRAEFAERVVALGAGAFALAVPAAAGIALLAPPIAGLVAMGLSLISSSNKRAMKKAVSDTLGAMERAGEFRAEDVSRALALLTDEKATILLSPTDLADAAKNEDFDGDLARRLAGSLVGRSDPLHPVLDAAFRASIAVLRRDETFHKGLTQALLLDAARKNGLQLHLLAELVDVVRRIEQEPKSAVVDASRDVLDHIAGLFGQQNPQALKLPALQEFLSAKAREFGAAKEDVATLRTLVPGIGNVLGEAEAALSRFDLVRAEKLLASARETSADMLREPLERNAQVMEAQASVALLRGRVDAAFRILSAAADSFAGIDFGEPARRRLRYVERLYQYGLRYGGRSMQAADGMLQDACRDLEGDQAGKLWGRYQLWIGCIAGERMYEQGGEERSALLRKAICAFKNAAAVLTESEDPEDWATAHNNLGLCRLEERLELPVDEWCRLVDAALAAFAKAFTVRTEEKYPAQWAETVINTGLAFLIKGQYLDQFPAVLATVQAIDAFETAIRKSVEIGDEWRAATGTDCLAAALRQEAHLVGGHEVTDRLEVSAAAYMRAQLVFTEQDSPARWSMSQVNIGNIRTDRGRLLGGEKGASELRAAIDAYRGALKYRCERDTPAEWALTQTKLGVAHAVLADNETCSDPCAELRSARDCFKGAQRVYDSVHMPQDHIRASAFLADVEHKLAQLCA